MSIQTVGVAGLGLLGRGIAACLLSHGLRVIALTRSERRRRAEARRYIAERDRRPGPSRRVPRRRSAVDWPDRYVEARGRRGAGLVRLRDRKHLRRPGREAAALRRDRSCRRRRPSRSPATRRPCRSPCSRRAASIPQRFIGMHWAEPCHLTRFLEVIRGDADRRRDRRRRDGPCPADRARTRRWCARTSKGSSSTASATRCSARRSGCWRMAWPTSRRIDRSFRNAISVWANIAGPFRWMDLTGLPAYAAVMERLWPKLSCATEVPATLRTLVDGGAKGISNGRGFYNYTPEEAAGWEQRLIDNVWATRAAPEGPGVRPGEAP